MRKLTATVAFLMLVCILSAAPIQAGFDLVYDAYFELPPLGYNLKWDFADVDSDGYPELLVRDTKNFHLFSISENRILYSGSVQDLLAQAGMESFWWYGLKVVAADINRDGNIDVLAGSHYSDGLCDPDGKYAFAFVNNLSPFSTVTVDTLLVPPHTGIGLLTAMDVNNDGFKELIVSYDTSDFVGGTPCQGGTSEGATIIYYSYPDSILFSFEYTLKNILPPVEMDSVHRLIGTVEETEWHMVPGETMTIETDRHISTIELPSNAYTLMSRNTPSHCNGDESNVQYNQLKAQAVGDLDGDPSTTELLATYYWNQSCTYSPGYIVWDSSSLHLEARRLTSAMSSDLLWRRDISHWYHRKPAYDPDFPGYFFSAGWDTLVQYDGATGDEVTVMEYPLGEVSFWADPFGDGKPRLCAYYPPHLVIYRLDQVTDVPSSDEPQNLPGSFTLGKAYPNPFNPSVSFALTLPRGDDVRVEVFNMLGQQVALLHDGQLSSGATVLTWHAEDNPSGMYLIRATTSEATRTTKAVLLK
ncbi:MAG: T9SS type A sorting domain-containing protein [candidate division Zixibacteria bacterium]|nr:T9SS type A sorting domain-containing protein [candidate division Zixibacteria bacterium]